MIEKIFFFTVHLLKSKNDFSGGNASEKINLGNNCHPNKYVFTADIKKMYRQILVHFKDVWSQCILWRDSPQLSISEYGLLTLTYGTRPDCARIKGLTSLFQS